MEYIYYGEKFKQKHICVYCLDLFIFCSAHNREMETIEYLDIERFMGDWYVIANIQHSLRKISSMQ